MANHKFTDEYFDVLIPDPVAVVLFADKVVIVDMEGRVTERELAKQQKEFDDDFQPGDS